MIKITHEFINKNIVCININLETLQSIDVKEYLFKRKDVTKLFYIMCVKIERTCTFQSSLIDDQCLFLCV